MKLWRKSKAITLVQNVRKMTCNNPKLDLVNMNVYKTRKPRGPKSLT